MTVSTTNPPASSTTSSTRNPVTKLNTEQINRYKRHLILPEVGPEGQMKLLNAKVLCIGAGGLGCPISLYLAAAGVGTIGLADVDVVSPSNLQHKSSSASKTLESPRSKLPRGDLKTSIPISTSSSTAPSSIAKMCST